MASQFGTLRDALSDAAGACDSRLAAIDTRLAVLTRMARTNIVLTVGVLFRLLTHDPATNRGRIVQSCVECVFAEG